VRLLIDALGSRSPTSPPWTLLVSLLVATAAASAGVVAGVWSWGWRRG